jgi:uncharacterized protein
MSATVIMVFAKAPRPGEVKTRLVPLLGAEGAAALHARLVKRTLATARKAGLGRIELHCAPDTDDPFFAFCGAHFDVALVPQSDGDLGARLLAASGRALAAHAHALLIGADCPVLTSRHLREAEGALRDGNEAVLAPCEDGGYAMLGLSQCDARLFEAIAWGNASVLADTRARLRQLNWRWRELETLWDVDRPEDHARLLALGLAGSGA